MGDKQEIDEGSDQMEYQQNAREQYNPGGLGGAMSNGGGRGHAVCDGKQPVRCREGMRGKKQKKVMGTT